MRNATAGDHWRKLYKNQYNSKILGLKYTNLRGLGQGQINFNGGITVICGANGVGKTTLLSAIFGVLKPKEIETMPDHFLRLNGSSLVGNFLKNGQTIEKNISFKDKINLDEINLDEIAVSEEAVSDLIDYIDPAYNCPEMIAMYSKMKNLDELLEGIECKNIVEEELQNISYIIGKQYSKYEIYEIEDLRADDKAVPYFRVECGGITYGTESMGLGEVSVSYILWSLKRLPKGAIVLIEEPETYISYRSQEGLLNIIAKICEANEIWAIITTHSAGILSKVPAEHIRLLMKVGKNVKITTPKTQLEHLNLLGIPIRKSGIIITEDRCAREFAKIWISNFIPHLLQEFDIIDIQGKDIITELNNIPKVGEWLKVVGVYDGDEKIEKCKSKCKWPVTFLPGEEAAEIMFKELADENVEKISKGLVRSEENVVLALSAVEAKDHHDWFEELHKNLGVDYNNLMKCLFDIWISNNDNYNLAKNSLNDLLRKLNIPHIKNL